jgi:hypothetical protein
MTVFREKTARAEPKLLTDEEQDELALQRGLFPPEQPPTLARLKEQLRELKPDMSRGLIVGGEQVGTETQKVAFEPDPTPVQAITIRYYHP